MAKSDKPKKKTTRKRKLVNNDLPRYHWTAFEEGELSTSKVNALAHDLVDGIKSQCYATVTGFRGNHIISYSRWKQMMHEHPVLARANETAKALIYERRINEAHEKKLDSRLISNDQLTMYCNEHKEHYEWLKNLDKDQARSEVPYLFPEAIMNHLKKDTNEEPTKED